MNIHEYQARELFESFGVATSKGKVASTPAEAAEAAKGLTGSKIVVKAQIHAGGRGKGTFKNGFKGGVHLCESPEEAREIAGQMLGQVLVTHQTGPEGKLVSKVLVAEAVDISRELYFAILLDRATSAPVVIASTEGGMDIEEVAEHTPEKIMSEPIHPLLGLQGYQTRKLAGSARPDAVRCSNQACKLFTRMYKLFVERDCSHGRSQPARHHARRPPPRARCEIQLRRQRALPAAARSSRCATPAEEDPREVAASEFDLNYIGLDGNIACLVNGAGLAMATMDIIQHSRRQARELPRCRRRRQKEQVTAAFKIILGDPNVKGILVNIFGGIMDCNVIATGIVAAAKETQLDIPLVVRLEGNNVVAGKKTLAESGLKLITGDDLADAAQKIVAAVKAA